MHRGKRDRGLPLPRACSLIRPPCTSGLGGMTAIPKVELLFQARSSGGQQGWVGFPQRTLFTWQGLASTSATGSASRRPYRTPLLRSSPAPLLRTSRN